MTFLDSHPEPVLRRLDDQPSIETFPGNSIRLIAPGSVTGAEFGFFEGSTGPGSNGAVPHYHKTFSETFYVLSGRLTVRAGARWEIASSGDVLRIPRGGVHAFRNDDEEEARYLILFTPGISRERYFADMAALYQRDTPPTVEEINEIAARHDQFNVH